MHRVSLVITGHVQGVGFRWYVHRQAQALGLSGEVSNRADGAVLVEAEGERHALERLLEAAGEGPMGAVVRNVQAHWSEGPARYRGFRISH